MAGHRLILPEATRRKATASASMMQSTGPESGGSKRSPVLMLLAAPC